MAGVDDNLMAKVLQADCSVDNQALCTADS